MSTIRSQDWRCVKCHVTAYGADKSQLADSYRDADGVGCEVCHGPGSAYAQADHGPSNPERYKLGFKKLASLEERETLCVKCHNPASPTYKPFILQEYSRVILHWVDPNDDAYREWAIRASHRREALVERKMAAEAAPAAQSRRRRRAPTAPCRGGRRSGDRGSRAAPTLRRPRLRRRRRWRPPPRSRRRRSPPRRPCGRRRSPRR